MGLAAVAAGLTLTLSGCGKQGPSSSGGPAQGVMGTVTEGPVCPVSRPGQRCRDKRIAAGLKVLGASGQVVKRARASRDGTFRIVLGPGRYVLVAKPSNGALLPRSLRQQLNVRRGHFERIRLHLDSGIR
jgi:hypothetical protein